MKTISQHQSGIDPPKEIPDTVRYVFSGAVIGVFASLAGLFAASTSYAALNGYEAVNCAVFGSVTTLLLSQPAALIGLIAGAACGGACAFIAHRVHRARKSSLN